MCDVIDAPMPKHAVYHPTNSLREGLQRLHSSPTTATAAGGGTQQGGDELISTMELIRSKSPRLNRSPDDDDDELCEEDQLVEQKAFQLPELTPIGGSRPIVAQRVIDKMARKDSPYTSNAVLNAGANSNNPLRRTSSPLMRSTSAQDLFEQEQKVVRMRTQTILEFMQQMGREVVAALTESISYRKNRRLHKKLCTMPEFSAKIKNKSKSALKKHVFVLKLSSYRQLLDVIEVNGVFDGYELQRLRKVCAPLARKKERFDVVIEEFAALVKRMRLAIGQIKVSTVIEAEIGHLDSDEVPEALTQEVRAAFRRVSQYADDLMTATTAIRSCIDDMRMQRALKKARALTSSGPDEQITLATATSTTTAGTTSKKLNSSGKKKKKNQQQTASTFSLDTLQLLTMVEGDEDSTSGSGSESTCKSPPPFEQLSYKQREQTVVHLAEGIDVQQPILFSALEIDDDHDDDEQQEHREDESIENTDDKIPCLAEFDEITRQLELQVGEGK